MSARAADFERSLLDAISEPRSRLALISVLARFRGQTIYLPTERTGVRRQRQALNMLKQQMPGDEIVHALCIRWNISERTARRDVERARGQIT